MNEPRRTIAACEEAQRECRRSRLGVLLSAVGALVICALGALAWAGATRDRLTRVETKVSGIEEKLGAIQTDIHDGFDSILRKLGE